MKWWMLVAGVVVLAGVILFAVISRRNADRQTKEGGWQEGNGAPGIPPARDAQGLKGDDRDSSDRGTLARMETSLGVMVLLLYEDQAPNTVANFVHLASKGYYDGLPFHRVIPNFMIQGGCPTGDGTGDPGWRIADEFVEGLSHDDAGVLSMANSGPDTNGSQFFITLAAAPWLDGKHTVFGRAVEGIEVLNTIGSVRTDAGDRPLTPVVIEKITLFRDGEQLTGEQPAPRTL